MNDYTVNRFTADIRVTTPSDYRVISSGDLKTDRASNDRTIYSFHYEKPSFPGSIAIVKGDPVRVSSQGIASQIFFRDQQAADAQAYGDEGGKIMTFLTSDMVLRRKRI